MNGRIDIVVSSGAQGRVPPKPFAEMTADEIVQAYQSRFLPRIFPVHAALPFMREHGGSIVMVGTDAARHPTPGESIVGAVGAGVILMTKVLAKELAGWHVRVNAVSLTLTSDTPSWDRIFGAEGNFQSKLFTKLSERFPLGPCADLGGSGARGGVPGIGRGGAGDRPDDQRQRRLVVRWMVSAQNV